MAFHLDKCQVLWMSISMEKYEQSYTGNTTHRHTLMIVDTAKYLGVTSTSDST